MNRFEALIEQSEIAVLIFADEGLVDFALVNARDFKLDPRFPRFVGTAGITGLRSASALKDELDPVTVQAVASAFAEYVALRVQSCFEPDSQTKLGN